MRLLSAFIFLELGAEYASTKGQVLYQPETPSTDEEDCVQATTNAFAETTNYEDVNSRSTSVGAQSSPGSSTSVPSTELNASAIQAHPARFNGGYQPVYNRPYTPSDTSAFSSPGTSAAVSEQRSSEERTLLSAAGQRVVEPHASNIYGKQAAFAA